MTALGHRQFRLIWLGFTASAVGYQTMFFALGWLLVQLALREGRPELAPLYLGIAGVSRGVPGLVAALLSGVYADRMDRRRLMVLARAVAAFVALGLAFLVLTDQVNLLWVVVLNALGAIADSSDLPVRMSAVARILEPRDLMSAQALVNTTHSVAGIVAPLLAGILIIAIGIGGLMLITAAASLVAAALLLGLDPMPPSQTTHAGVIRSLRDGLVFVMSEPVLRWVVILSATASIFARPMVGLLPAVAANTLQVGASELSWLLAASAVGGIAGTFAAVGFSWLGPPGKVMLVMVVLWGLLDVLFGLQHELVPALLLVGLPHVCWSAFASLGQVLCQQRAPDHLRGRTLSMYGVTISAFVPLGALVLGGLGTLFGVSTALIIGGLLTSAMGVVALAVSPQTRAAELS